MRNYDLLSRKQKGVVQINKIGFVKRSAVLRTKAKHTGRQ